MDICTFTGGTILIPQTDLTAFSVIACDQYTSEPEYWKQAAAIADGKPSALNLIFPEAELGAPEANSERIRKIHDAMWQSLSSGLFREYPDAMILTERTLRDGSVRYGILGLIDLEQYDYHTESESFIRATEQTVLARVESRKELRDGSALDIPHLMLLVDDRDKELVEPLIARIGEFEKIYDFSLMQNSGHLRGYLIPKDGQEHIAAVLEKWSDPSWFRRKYRSTSHPMVLAVGDGNHSLAAAKNAYERIKERIGAEAAASHPARYALAELNNLHDPAITFEPIYRVLKGADLDDLLNFLRKSEPAFHGGSAQFGETSLYFQCGLERRTLSIPAQPGILPVQILQPLLDAYLAEHPEVSIDYIHGLDTVRALAGDPACIGITFSGIRKDEVFGAVIHGDVLPRKTFSIGHAEDKRFYLESRRILTDADREA